MFQLVEKDAITNQNSIKAITTEEEKQKVFEYEQEILESLWNYIHQNKVSDNYNKENTRTSR